MVRMPKEILEVRFVDDLMVEFLLSNGLKESAETVIGCVELGLRYVAGKNGPSVFIEDGLLTTGDDLHNDALLSLPRY